MKELNKELPKVSILISTKNRRKDLQLAIDSIKQMDYPKTHYEIVVVEETNQPKPIKGVKYVHIPEEGKGFGYSRNIAVENARYPIVAFTDDDCQVEKDWLKELVVPFQKGAGAVVGAVKVKNCGSLGHCENTLGFPGGGIKYIHRAEKKIYSTNQISTCNAAFITKVIKEAGGFPFDTPFSGEDSLLAEKVTEEYPCYFTPKAIVYHKPRQSLWAIFKWFIRRGKSALTVAYLSEHKSKHILWNFYTSISLRFIVLLSILFLLKINLFFSLAILFCIYYMFTIIRYKYMLKYYNDYKALFLLPVVKLVMDIGMDYGRFAYLLRKVSLSK